MFLKNKNIFFKIRRSKVIDYAALNKKSIIQVHLNHFIIRKTFRLFCNHIYVRKSDYLSYICDIVLLWESFHNITTSNISIYNDNSNTTCLIILSMVEFKDILYSFIMPVA